MSFSGMVSVNCFCFILMDQILLFLSTMPCDSVVVEKWVFEKKHAPFSAFANCLCFRAPLQVGLALKLGISSGLSEVCILPKPICGISSPLCSQMLLNVLISKRVSFQLLFRASLFMSLPVIPSPWRLKIYSLFASFTSGSVQFSSVQSLSRVRLFATPMNRSTPGLPVHHQLPEFTQTHIHRVSDTIQTSHPLLSPSPPAPNPSQDQSLFTSGTHCYFPN